MRTIHKYPLVIIPSEQVIETYALMIPLAVQLQNGHPTLWYQVYTASPRVYRTVHIVGTGHEVPPDCDYIGTVQIGSYVWHFYLEVA